MKWPILGLALFTFTGCASVNTIERIEQADSVVKYQKNSDQPRFSNLYPGEKTYPETCEENCYPASPLLACESPAENCRFTGRQSPPALNTGFNIRWLGHASFYIESPDGSRLLFDPVSGQFDWPVNWAFRLKEGFNRKQGDWPSKAEVADTDAVLYSHIHYDHFNKDDIGQIGNNSQYFVPLGFAEHFPEDGYHINEMTWFSSKSLGELNIHFVPAHHFSSRIWVPFLYEDNNTALWGGWVLEHKGKTPVFCRRYRLFPTFSRYPAEIWRHGCVFNAYRFLLP